MTQLAPPKPLANLTFLITRPKRQAQNLCASIEASGGHCIVFPTLEISPLLMPPPLSEVQFSNSDKVIFVSANAVYPVMPYWPHTNDVPAVYAIGPGTAKALAGFQIQAHMPSGNEFTSEGLLALPELQTVAAQKILIVSGSGGRMILENTLKSRRAQVQQIAVYQRTCPKVDFLPCLMQWRQQRITCIISTSSESLSNLWQMAGEVGQRWLRQMRLLVISRSMAELAQTLGFQAPLVADNASDNAILAALLFAQFAGKHNLHPRQ